MDTRRKLVGVAAAALVLASCGGGGGGGSGGGGSPTAPSAPNFDLDKTSIDASVSVAAAASAEFSVLVQVQNLPRTATIYPKVTFTQTIISDAFVLLGPPSLLPEYPDGSIVKVGGEVRIFLKNQRDFVPNRYSDSVQIRLCLDPACNTEIHGSRSSVNITLDIVRPTGALAPRISVPSNQISLDVLPLNVLEKRVAVAINYSNVDYVPFATTTIGGEMLDLVQSAFSPVGASYDAIFRAPSTAGLGLHTGTVKIRACLDVACVNEMDNSPLTVTINYNVTNQLSLAGGHTLQLVPLDHNGIVWDSHNERFFFVRPASSDVDPDSVGSYDPFTGIQSANVTAGLQAGSIAESDDGSFLYVGLAGSSEIKRFSLPSLSTDLSISLGNAPITGDPLYARAIQVLPGAAHSVAVPTGSRFGGTDGSALVVFDDGIRRSDFVGAPILPNADPFVETMCWGESPGKLYGARFEFAPQLSNPRSALYDMTVSATGVTLNKTFTNISYEEPIAKIVCPPNRVLVSDGNVFDPTDGSVAKTFGSYLNAPRNIALNNSANKIFGAFGSNGMGTHPQIKSFAFADFSMIDSIELPDDADSSFRFFQKWKSGVAYEIAGNGSNTRAYGKFLVLISGPMFGP